MRRIATTLSRAVSMSLLVLLTHVGLPASARADSITITNNTSGIAILAVASDGNSTVRQSLPMTIANVIDRSLTALSGSTTARAAASLTSSVADPTRMSGRGTASVSYETTTGVGDVSGLAEFAVTFLLQAPHTYEFLGQFAASGDESRASVTEKGRWMFSLLGAAPVFNDQGTDSINLSSAGTLSPGLYRFLVQASAIGTNDPGPASVNAHSNFAFALNLTEQSSPAPVPEPTSMFLLGAGLAGTFAARRRHSASR